MTRRTGAPGALALILATLATVPALVAPVPARAAEETPGRELIVRSEEQTRSRTETTAYSMELVGSDGETIQTRRLEVYFKRSDGAERTAQKFLAPPTIEGTGLLIEDTGGEANDIWLYLPATRRLRRISGVEKSNWYMGTEFAFEDFEDYQIPFYDFRLTGEEQCPDGGHCSLVAAVPATAAEREASGYSKKVYWIESESLYPVRVDYYAEDGHRVKELVNGGLEQVGDYWRPRTIVMRNLDNGQETRMTVEEREVDAPLDDYYVTKRFLRSD